MRRVRRRRSPSDTLPAGATAASRDGRRMDLHPEPLLAGWSRAPTTASPTAGRATLTLTITVPPASETITNTATVTSTTADPSDGNNTVVTTTMIGGGADAGGTCAVDGDCGGASSGFVCDAVSMTCVSGCRGQGAATAAPQEKVCTSANTTIGQCVTRRTVGTTPPATAAAATPPSTRAHAPTRRARAAVRCPTTGRSKGGGFSCTAAPGRGARGRHPGLRIRCRARAPPRSSAEALEHPPQWVPDRRRLRRLRARGSIRWRPVGRWRLGDVRLRWPERWGRCVGAGEVIGATHIALRAHEGHPRAPGSGNAVEGGLSQFAAPQCSGRSGLIVRHQPHGSSARAIPPSPTAKGSPRSERPGRGFRHAGHTACTLFT